MATIKLKNNNNNNNPENNKCWGGCEETRPLFTVSGNVNWCDCYGKQNKDSSKKL